MNIVQIDPRLIDDHPRNVEIYGDESLSEDFIESIRKVGVRQPLTVRQVSGDRYQNIGGHRRKHAALHLELPEVPCEIVELETESEILELLVTLNADREKTPGMRWREMETLEIALTEAARERQTQALKNAKTPPSPTRGQGEKSGRTVELLADRFRYSRRFVERLQTVFSDRYRAECLRELEGNSKVANRIGGCMASWNEIRSKCDCGEMSVSSAADAIVKLRKETLTPPRPKKEKPAPQPKPTKPKEPKLAFRKLGAEDIQEVKLIGDVMVGKARVHLGQFPDGSPALLVHPYILQITVTHVSNLAKDDHR